MSDRRKGFALVSVLWAVALLSLIAHSMVSDSTTATMAERSGWMREKLERDMLVGLAHTILSLTDSRVERRWFPNGKSQKLVFDGASMTISVRDEIGKIDLNYADGDIIYSLLKNIGLPKQEAEDLRDRIIAWRSPPDSTSFDKGNPAKTLYRPRHAPFQSVDELALVKGISMELLEKVRPALTVHSQASTIDPQVASRQAIEALPGMASSNVDNILASQEKVWKGDMLSVSLLGTRAYSVDMEAQRGSARQRRVAIIRITPQGPRPYLLLSWQERNPYPAENSKGP